MPRVDNWETALDAYLDETYEKPFEYGTHDCCLFAAGWIERVLGVDVATEYRGRYMTALGAARLIRKVTGGGTPEDCMDKAAADFDHIVAHPSIWYAQRGDIVSLETGGHVSLGIVDLDGRTAWFLSDNEMTRYPIAECKRAWHLK